MGFNQNHNCNIDIIMVVFQQISHLFTQAKLSYLQGCGTQR